MLATKSGHTGPHKNIDPNNSTAVANFLLQMKHTCTLDVAPGGLTLDEVGKVFELTRERIRQIEFRALHRRRMAKILIQLYGRAFLEQELGSEAVTAALRAEDPSKVKIPHTRYPKKAKALSVDQNLRQTAAEPETASRTASQ
jgi:hypothetical protein